MSQKIMNEQDEHAAERQIVAILQSPQGREFGRWFLTEMGKPQPDLAQMKRELFDIFSRKVDELYASDKPVMSR